MTETANAPPLARHWPRSLHVSNVANVAYGYAKILVRHRASVEVICHDVTHLMSQPEWDDLALDPKDFPDENRFDFNTADLGDYRRPAWFKSETLQRVPPGLPTRLLRFIAGRLPTQTKRRFEPIYYRVLRLLDRWGAPSSAHSDAASDKGQIEALAAIASRLGPAWAVDTVALASYSRQGHWVSAHAVHADVVFSYALAPIYSLFCDGKPRISVELGTMRDVPFGASMIGRLLWLGYRLSDHIIITNPDDRKLAERAGIRNYSFCPHPIDQTIFTPGQDLEWKRHLQEKYRAETLLFAPARQNWRVKGNDQMFQGFAHALASGCKAVLLVPGWGQEVSRSKKLCRELGIADRVAWLSPLPEPWLARYYRAVDLVLDQFQLGVFGLITPKALACGAVVLTSYDDEHHGWCFPTHPPVVRCRSGEDIGRAISRLSRDAKARSAIGAASSAWIAKYHSCAVVAECLIQAMQSARLHFASRADHRSSWETRPERPLTRGSDETRS